MFQIHAYSVLWVRLGRTSVALWTSVVAATALLISAIFYVVSSASGGLEPPGR
ncbi:hypothetical protein [Amycolatopsis lexingtonensis]|uniref:hypothetical protein n=1 Tax=Amycolatopsis lexingtonensis TaxID=218822 RepID=UPI003F714D0F